MAAASCTRPWADRRSSSDLERGRREGTIADHVELVKIAHASDLLPMLQSGTTEAQDLDYTSRHMEMDYSILRWSDRPFILYGTSGEKARDGIAPGRRSPPAGRGASASARWWSAS